LGAVIGMAIADQVRDGLLPRAILDSTSFASVAQLLDRDGYRLDHGSNTTTAAFISSKHPSDMLLTNEQYLTSGSDLRNDPTTRVSSLRQTVRKK
jgi:hypothetical protein